MTNTMRVIIESVPKSSPEIFIIASGILTPVIACIALYIAFRQHQTEKNRLKSELFDRRKEVYSALESFFHDFMTEGPASYIRSSQLIREISISVFLFDKDVQEYLNRLYAKSHRSFILQKLLFNENGDKREGFRGDWQEGLNEQNEIIKWIMDQSEKAVTLFRPYFEIR